jgi:hypothetical protein
MENYSNNKIFKFLAERSSVLALISVGIIAVGVLSFTGAGKYLLGSLLNGVNINTPTNLNRYAYGENIGWIDFDPIVSGTPTMQIGDNGLTGYVWGENIGWINLGSAGGPPYANTLSTNWGLNNTTEGCASGYSCLYGYAYGENIGWINFDPIYSGTHYGVKISTTGSTAGQFSGYAYGENIGWVSFSGTGYGVITDWRPPAPTCTSFTYSDWSACSSGGTQTRTVASSSPSGCAGGSPVLSQSCTYVPPCDDSNWTFILSPTDMESLEEAGNIDNAGKVS